MAPGKRMGKKPADVSHPSHPTPPPDEPEYPCYRCQGDVAADPCGPCPLYWAYLERSELADDPIVRATYDAWARAGGWRVVWTFHRLEQHRSARREVMALRAAYPRVNPAIVARMLEIAR